MQFFKQKLEISQIKKNTELLRINLSVSLVLTGSRRHGQGSDEHANGSWSQTCASFLVERFGGRLMENQNRYYTGETAIYEPVLSC